MDRKKQIIEYVKKNSADSVDVLGKTIEEMVWLEGKLDELKKLPFIQVHPSNEARQRATPASRQYKELLQQYTNIVKIIEKTAGGGDELEESPLRQWIKSVKDVDFNY